MSARVQQPVPPEVANLTALAVSVSRDPTFNDPPRELHDLEQARAPIEVVPPQQSDPKDAVDLKGDDVDPAPVDPPHADWQPTHGGKRKPFLLRIRSSVYFMMFTVVRLFHHFFLGVRDLLMWLSVYGPVYRYGCLRKSCKSLFEKC